MGCFGGGKQPTYTPPPAPKLPTAEELMASAVNTAKTEQPLGYGARESGLADLAKGTEYYQGFQPTSFEQALGDQYFKNVMPTAENKILNYLSLAGISNSPITARLIGDQYAKTGVDVGTYLSDLGNQRAKYSLDQRLGIDPWSITNPLLETGMNQSNNQANLDYDYAQQVAMANYANEMENYNQAQARNKSYMMLGGLGLGALGGAMFLPGLMGAAPAMSLASGGVGTAAGSAAMSAGSGALMGGSIGSGIGGMLGGDQNSLGSGIALANQFRPQTQNVWSGGSGGLSIDQYIALMKAGVIK